MNPDGVGQGRLPAEVVPTVSLGDEASETEENREQAGTVGGAENVLVRGGAASTNTSKPVRTCAQKPWRGGHSKGAVGASGSSRA